MIVASTLAALALAALHLLLGRLRSLGWVPRQWWLSFAGGVAVAHVFLLPKLESGRPVLPAAGLLGDLERQMYLVALGSRLSRAARRSSG